MYALVFLCILACVFAVPIHPPPYKPQHHYPQHRYPQRQHHHDSSWEDSENDDVLDTSGFYDNFQKNMEQLNAMIAEVTKQTPTQTTSGLQGNQYKININLNDFDEKDITVKAKEGFVMVQAVHKTADGSEKNYLDIRTLPSFVKAGSGIWTYTDGTLKVVFEVQESSTNDVAVVTSEPTQAPHREEIESQERENTDQDADVGVRGDNGATTHAVDFNNKVEFVPACLKQVAK